MNRVWIRRSCSLGLVAFAACAETPAVTLRLADAAGAAGHTFTGEMMQSVIIEREEGDVTVDRELRLRFRTAEAQPAGEGLVNVVLALDSMRSAMSTPHGRQVYDTRRQLGTRYTLRYATHGGRPDYSASPDAADFASLMGGPPPISLVLDWLFPPLPDSAVRVGDEWERDWTENQLEAMSVRERRVTGRFKLARIEQRDGTRLAHIEIVASREPDSGVPADSAAPATLQTRGTVLLGVGDGVVREAALEEVVTGSAMFPGGRSTFRQTTRYRLMRVDGLAIGATQ